MKLKTLLKTVVETHYEIEDESDNLKIYDVDYLRETKKESDDTIFYCETKNALPQELLNKKVDMVTVNHVSKTLVIYVQ